MYIVYSTSKMFHTPNQFYYKKSYKFKSLTDAIAKVNEVVSEMKKQKASRNLVQVKSADTSTSKAVVLFEVSVFIGKQYDGSLYGKLLSPVFELNLYSDDKKVKKLVYNLVKL